MLHQSPRAVRGAAVTVGVAAVSVVAPGSKDHRLAVGALGYQPAVHG